MNVAAQALATAFALACLYGLVGLFVPAKLPYIVTRKRALIAFAVSMVAFTAFNGLHEATLSPEQIRQREVKRIAEKAEREAVQQTAAVREGQLREASERQAQLKRTEEARTAEAKTAADLSKTEDVIDGFRRFDELGSVEMVSAILGVMDSTWDALRLGSASSDPATQQRAHQLASRMSEAQEQQFPRFRSAWVRAVGRLLWEQDIDVECAFNGCIAAYFTGGSLARNAEKARLNGRFAKDLERLRFRRALYRWADIADGDAAQWRYDVPPDSAPVGEPLRPLVVSPAPEAEQGSQGALEPSNLRSTPTVAAPSRSTSMPPAATASTSIESGRPRPADAATGAVAPVRVGGSIKPPTRIKHVPPVYPEIAQSARVQGVVIVEATISPEGKVTDTKILRSVPLLDEPALAAVRQWEYTPTLLQGVAVSVIMTVTVNFTLQ